MQLKTPALLMPSLILMALMFQACPSPEPAVYTAPTFNATNTSATGDEALTASDNKIIVNKHYTVTITINDIPHVYTGTCSSNELPVSEGNEVSIIGSFGEDAATGHIRFTLPDGTYGIVSKVHPTYNWTVPADIAPGDKIVAQWVDNTGNIPYPELSSSITLIDFK